ncbi:MAG: lamin tail domain-containing protein, partial [Bacteroidia bacterium]|nr:lamin tail domain-containing protein [Bacteroidia bacterium]
EILYNPANPGYDWEWIELYNLGDSTIDLSGFVVDDDNPSAHKSANIQEGQMLPRQSAVLYNADKISAGDFTAAWGPDINLVAVSNWKALKLNDDGDKISLWMNFDSYQADHRTHRNAFYTLHYGQDGFPNPAQSSMYIKDLYTDDALGQNWASSALGRPTPVHTTFRSRKSGGEPGH